MKQNRREIGAFYEKKTAEMLQGKGYAIIQKNYRTRIGEIDLIVRDGKTLVFVEVKSLIAHMNFDPAERVTAKKQETIRKVALRYLVETNQYETCPVRFDVVAWRMKAGSEVFQHIINAF